MANRLTENDWKFLLKMIENGRCTAFLGAGACRGILPLGSEIAEEWAKKYDYPFPDRYDLPRVAQFRALMEEPVVPKMDILDLLSRCPYPNFNSPDEPHGVLADLPIPIYLTTNYDDFMVKALESRGRNPRREICRWNRFTQEHIEEASIFNSAQGFEPTPDDPLVFHFHGDNRWAESLVLTEDDYIDFLVNTSADENLIPKRIRRALAGSSLLFLGYSLRDVNFRVLFRKLLGFMERGTNYPKIAVQLVPESGLWCAACHECVEIHSASCPKCGGTINVPSSDRELAQKYLDKYFENEHIKIYWGTSRDFAKELSMQWQGFNSR